MRDIVVSQKLRNGLLMVNKLKLAGGIEADNHVMVLCRSTIRERNTEREIHLLREHNMNIRIRLSRRQSLVLLQWLQLINHSVTC